MKKTVFLNKGNTRTLNTGLQANVKQIHIKDISILNSKRICANVLLNILWVQDLLLNYRFTD